MTQNVLAPAVGDELPPLTAGPVDRELLARFAEASGDDNPIHLDPAAAAEAGHPDVIAHGMLSMAYLGRLVGEWVPQHRIRSLRARFVAPTPLGARPTCTGRVLSVSEEENGLLAKLSLTVKLADGTTTVRGEALVAFPLSSPAAP
ncbi:MaoC/PaaZ C-terminal domain-containing protein [Amycolatopsis benzoatilytica]|uniref:MaoC/PaaZ C-terminal domain-containing protein n=1 Tax=Amycolatopsis benzoatilytica TaxID=346045 RepID=UPI000368C222|nr:MaoC/PaaZ C-terminal domain-containing protein [Amycolatopsis benzoatilytica]